MNYDDMCQHCPLKQNYHGSLPLKQNYHGSLEENNIEIYMEDDENEEKTSPCSSCPFKKNKKHAVLVIPISMN